jgi:hypothetical protein
MKAFLAGLEPDPNSAFQSFLFSNYFLSMLLHCCSRNKGFLFNQSGSSKKVRLSMASTYIGTFKRRSEAGFFRMSDHSKQILENFHQQKDDVTKTKTTWGRFDESLSAVI